MATKDNVKEKISIVKGNATTFSEKLNALYKVINTEEGIVLSEEYTEQDILNAVTNFGNTYILDIRKVF